MAPRGVARSATLGADTCRYTPPTAVGKFGKGSAWCGGDRQTPPSVQGRSLASGRLPPSRGVAVADKPPSVQARNLVAAHLPPSRTSPERHHALRRRPAPTCGPPSVSNGSTGALAQALDESSALISVANDEDLLLKGVIEEPLVDVS